MAGGESLDSNLRPNRVPAREWMNQAIGNFFIGFRLKCSYQKQQQQCANQQRPWRFNCNFFSFLGPKVYHDQIEIQAK